jgi:integrase
MGGPGWHIEKRSRSSWLIAIELGRGPDGKRRRIRQSFRGTKKEAEAEAQRLYVECVVQGGYVAPNKLTVAEYLPEWLERHATLKRLAPKTKESYQHLIERYLVPALGHLPLQSLEPRHIEELAARMLRDEDYAPRTVSYALTILGTALKKAVRDRIIRYNPMDAVDKPSYQAVKYNLLSPQEVKRFREAIYPSPWYPLFWTALGTGARREELLALRWSRDVDLEGATIWVREAVVATKKGLEIGPPKTLASIRPISIDASVVEALWRQREAHSHDLVFPAIKNGGYMHPSTASHAFKRLARKAGFPQLRLHDLRHIHASLLIAAGVPYTVVQARLGHAKPSTTVDIYTHSFREAERSATEAFGRLFT